MNGKPLRNAKTAIPCNRQGLLFQADILAANEYLACVGNRMRADPTKRLMLAVLRTGVLDFQKYLFASRAEERILHGESELWIMEESGCLFSFRSICEVLQLDADYLRSGLLKWKAQYVRQAGGMRRDSHPVMRQSSPGSIQASRR